MFNIIIGMILLIASAICTQETEEAGVFVAGIIVMFMGGFIIAKGLGI